MAKSYVYVESSTGRQRADAGPNGPTGQKQVILDFGIQCKTEEIFTISDPGITEDSFILGQFAYKRIEGGLSWNGSDWEDGITDFGGGWAGVTFCNGRFIACSNTQSAAVPSLMRSSDGGLTWEDAWSGADNLFQHFHDIATDGVNTVVSIGTSSISGNAITAKSSNGGVSWTGHTDLSDFVIYHKIVYAAGRSVKAAGALYSAARHIKHSTDGITWTLATFNLPLTTGKVQDIAFGNGIFVAVTRNGTAGFYSIMTSTDGITWNCNTSFTDLDLRRVIFGNGKFIIFDQTVSGLEILTSTDGLSWIRSDFNCLFYTPISAEASFFAKGLFFCEAILVGLGRGFLVSEDSGESWICRSVYPSPAFASDYVYDPTSEVSVGVRTDATNVVIRSDAIGNTKDADDMEMESVHISFAPGNGFCTVFTRALQGSVHDKFALNYKVD